MSLPLWLHTFLLILLLLAIVEFLIITLIKPPISSILAKLKFITLNFNYEKVFLTSCQLVLILAQCHQNHHPAISSAKPIKPANRAIRSLL